MATQIAVLNYPLTFSSMSFTEVKEMREERARVNGEEEESPKKRKKGKQVEKRKYSYKPGSGRKGDTVEGKEWKEGM